MSECRVNIPDFVCLVPVFNDWESVSRIATELQQLATAGNISVDVLIVNDGSSKAPENLFTATSNYRSRIQILNLLCNLGHQRAIAVGLAYLAEEKVTAPIVVMDGDGEDQPAHAPELVDALRKAPGLDVVFAARTRRLESWHFQTLYHLFRLTHWILTGIPIRFGNFSAITPAAVDSLSVSPDLWSHYAAAVLNSKLRFGLLPIPKGKRYHGRSHMRFSTLVAHGLSGIAVFNEVMTARLLLACMLLAVLLAGLMAALFALRFLTDIPPPGWTTIVGGILIVLFTQVLLSLLVLTFGVLGNRSARRVIPRLDGHIFIKSIVHIDE